MQRERPRARGATCQLLRSASQHAWYIYLHRIGSVHIYRERDQAQGGRRASYYGAHRSTHAIYFYIEQDPYIYIAQGGRASHYGTHRCTYGIYIYIVQDLYIQRERESARGATCQLLRSVSPHTWYISIYRMGSVYVQRERDQAQGDVLVTNSASQHAWYIFLYRIGSVYIKRERKRKGGDVLVTMQRIAACMVYIHIQV